MDTREEYIAEGGFAIVPKGDPGNPFAALYVSKNLSELEKLWLMGAKLEIENVSQAAMNRDDIQEQWEKLGMDASCRYFQQRDPCPPSYAEPR